MFSAFWLSKANLSDLKSGESLWITAYCATADFGAAFDVDPTSEEAERTLTWLAIWSGAGVNPAGVVAIATVDNPSDVPEADRELGEVRISVSLADINAFFVVDAPDISPILGEWGSAAVEEFIASTDLLWFDVSEVNQLSI